MQRAGEHHIFFGLFDNEVGRHGLHVIDSHNHFGGQAGHQCSGRRFITGIQNRIKLNLHRLRAVVKPLRDGNNRVRLAELKKSVIIKTIRAFDRLNHFVCADFLFEQDSFGGDGCIFNDEQNLAAG